MVLLKNSLLVVASLLGLATTVLANVENWNPEGDGCVDPSGYLSCYSDIASAMVSCTGNCNTTSATDTQQNQDCLVACNGYHEASKIGCWIQSCWNQVFSCEYQLTAAHYFDENLLVQGSQIPFYPPPDDVAGMGGTCSCNLGYVYGNKTFIQQNNCLSTISSGGDASSCQCCQFSQAVSNSLNICPKSDLSLMAFDKTLSLAQELLSSISNCPVLDSQDAIGTCSDVGFAYFGTVYNPMNLPSDEPGTEPLSNLPGNAFTDPGGDTYTLELFPGYSSVISLAPFKADAGVETGTVDGGGVATATAATTGAGSGGGKGTGAATGKGTGTGSAVSPTKTGGGNMAHASFWACLLAMISVLLLRL